MSTYTRNPGAPDVRWQIKDGQRLARPDIHAVYGGRPTTAISPCKSASTNILLFAVPRPYPACSNEWIDHRFGFHGEGARGDHQMKGGNRAILDHAADGDRALRLFTQAGDLWQYEGRFKLDESVTIHGRPGIVYDEAVDQDNRVRQVIIFVLVPVGDIATVILGEDDLSWVVECERYGCERRLGVPKRVGIPNDYRNPDWEKTTWREEPYPSQKWCLDHPPRRARLALSSQSALRAEPHGLRH